MNTAYWKNDDICHMTTSAYFLKWNHIRASYGQHYGHWKNIYICSNKKVNENEHKHWENVETR